MSLLGSALSLNLEWEDESTQKPERPEILRLIFRGRFLHGSTPLSGTHTSARQLGD